MDWCVETECTSYDELTLEARCCATCSDYFTPPTAATVTSVTTETTITSTVSDTVTTTTASTTTKSTTTTSPKTGPSK